MKIMKKLSAVSFGASSYPSCSNILGESAPSERQVSPEKLYRAALLRSRFADTILKAREKTLEKVGPNLDSLYHLIWWIFQFPSLFYLVCVWSLIYFVQGEKGDPEKLRLEREELERRQKEGLDLHFQPRDLICAASSIYLNIGVLISMENCFCHCS